MKTTRIKINGMTCLNCVTHVQKALEAVPGVNEVSVLQDEGAVVQHENANPDQLLRAIQAAGDYEASILEEARAH